MSMIASTMVRPRRRALRVCLSLCVALSLAAPAYAQNEEERANARAAAGAGADAFDAGNYQKAADYFERAETLVHSPVHLWYIARSVKELGQLVKARELCMRVVREGTTGASSGVLAANDGCRDILKELEGRVPTLTIEVEGLEKGVKYSVERNGAAVALAVIGIPAPVDPGEYTVSGRADGFFAPEQKVTLAEGGTASITLTFQPGSPAVVDAPTEPAPAEPTDAPPTTPAADQPPQADGGTKSGPPVASYILWGGGLGAVAFGVVMGIDSKNKADEVSERCGGDPATCRVDAGSRAAGDISSLNDQAGTSQILSIVGYGVGGAAIATGFVLWIVDMNKNKGKASTALYEEPRLRPVLGFGHVGVAGTF